MNYKRVTTGLFARITSEVLAKELEVSAQLVRQARSRKTTLAYRQPPRGWEKAALRLAKKQAAHFKDLASKLETRIAQG